MGMYDSFMLKNLKGKYDEFQLKSGENRLNRFIIGDEVKKFGYIDGIHFEDCNPKGFIVVFKGIYVAAFSGNKITNKYGNEIEIKN